MDRSYWESLPCCRAWQRFGVRCAIALLQAMSLAEKCAVGRLHVPWRDYLAKAA